MGTGELARAAVAPDAQGSDRAGVPPGVMFRGFVGMMARHVMMGFTHRRQLGLRRVRQCESAQEYADQQQGENSLHIPSFPRGPSERTILFQNRQR